MREWGFRAIAATLAAIAQLRGQAARPDRGLYQVLGPSISDVTVLDAYTGNTRTRHLQSGQSLESRSESEDFGGWYDMIVTTAGDPTFNYRLAGHVETGRDSISDPALGGLIARKR